MGIGKYTAGRYQRGLDLSDRLSDRVCRSQSVPPDPGGDETGSAGRAHLCTGAGPSPLYLLKRRSPWPPNPAHRYSRKQCTLMAKPEVGTPIRRREAYSSPNDLSR